MSVEPWINWQFHKAPGLIDPRASFVRASVARTVNRIGLLAAKPANAARFRFNPVSGVCEGLLSEPQRTNLVLYSEDFTNAAWTKTALTATGNSTTAPDGTVTADTLAATGTSGNVAQAITITAGRGIAFGPYLKANASSWAILSISDGTNSVAQWFDLASGAKGTNTAGGTAGGLSLLFAQSWIEAHPTVAGWYRCAVEVTSSVSTSVIVSILPAAADNTDSANGNSCYAWGAQAEAEATYTNLTSYIPTTSATVTRNADNLLLGVTSSQVPLDRGTMVFDFVARHLPPQIGGQTPVLGGIGDTFDNTIYVSRIAATGIGVNYRSGGVGASTISRTCAFTPGTTYRVGVLWQSGRLAMCIDGGTLTSTTTSISPLASVARISVGFNPFSASSGSNVSNMVHRAFMYAPVTVSDATLQALTAG